ncbi:MAG: MBL fold metallo-hydrolase [Gammaproteobacteria bacterium]|nr:MBL fold metallo-hydrolase [Gammaproteobacteria bacterium]MDH5801415.1 MBL fold metallo-hydrolase [Gammaproteobacteria bacterium]
MEITFYGAAGEVTGSCHLLQVGQRRVLLDCGLIQGAPVQEARNRHAFPFKPGSIDAVILSHAHIDHSGRIPLLVKAGFTGPIYTQTACRDLCRIMLKDAGFINEKNAEWENRKRQRKGLEPIDPLFTVKDTQSALRRFVNVEYEQRITVVPGLELRLLDAGHILGSSIVELVFRDNGGTKTLVYSGDLGKSQAPILRDPAVLEHADMVVMESTYGDRLHKSAQETIDELSRVIEAASSNSGGNILIPSFAVGRSQELLYLFGKYYKQWGLNNWQVFLDSPMAIEATEVYFKHKGLYDHEARDLWRSGGSQLFPNLCYCRTAGQSMKLNLFHSGAIIIAGSGMCNGGRIRHHLKHNIWRKDCHIVFVGFQAQGTPGRAIVDGARYIRLWGETIRVRAKIHTIGGFSAHADRDGLMQWYGHFNTRPPLVLVHGEDMAMSTLQKEIETRYGRRPHCAEYGETLKI